ncbi:hypothetical protein CcaverHIS641_0607360 [Cutaneotrichosporon cavernicola]|nr:hypothetical protein CcaverHIS641_0607360 [Cutaneotrichosporon cavernicola]
MRRWHTLRARDIRRRQPKDTLRTPSGDEVKIDHWQSLVRRVGRGRSNATRPNQPATTARKTPPNACIPSSSSLAFDPAQGQT